jgi:sterol desaturase/sphingolipid hydroxylase (fatty acid hydroxylase superfamily)
MNIIINLFLILFAYLYATFLEWVVHKYVLHGIGKNKDSWFNFHWHSHHKKCRKNKNKDDSYETFLALSVRREILGLYALLVFHLPVYFLSPYFFYTLIICTIRYFYVHQKSHRNVEWGKKNIPWHYDHHMGKDQDANWGVTTDIWDTILKTRKKGTKV